MPSIYCHRIVVGEKYKKPFEKLIFNDSSEKKDKSTDQLDNVREIIARRAALEFQDGMYGMKLKK